MTSFANTFVEPAPAKVNLTLRVLGRRSDGYHELESLVAFAALGDRLSFEPGPALDLAVDGPTARQTGPLADNIVLKAARALARRVENLTLGRFSLVKELPAAAGIGGGSSDAAAALRLLARANGVPMNDPRVAAAARETGADVPVCLEARARIMRGRGDILLAPLDLPRRPALLVNPGMAVATKDVFAALAMPIQEGSAQAMRNESPLEHELRPRASPFETPPSAAPQGEAERKPHPEEARSAVSKDEAPALGIGTIIDALRRSGNDLEAPAVKLYPVIADVLRRLGSTQGCLIARMSGSGATCFGLYETMEAAEAAGGSLAAAQPGWWVRATTLS